MYVSTAISDEVRKQDDRIEKLFAHHLRRTGTPALIVELSAGLNSWSFPRGSANFATRFSIRSSCLRTSSLMAVETYMGSSFQLSRRYHPTASKAMLFMIAKTTTTYPIRSTPSSHTC